MDGGQIDYYETLQISPNAEPDTVHRVYRMLAQRFHPDNAETGNATRFRELVEAYQVLSDPERRAKYDVAYQRDRQERWRLVATAAESENDFVEEQFLRLTVLEVLYTKRRLEPQKAGLYIVELEKMTGRPREHLEFTVWYLGQKKLVQQTENSTLAITADGVEYLEQSYGADAKKKRLRAVND